MDPNRMPGGGNRRYAGQDDDPPSYSEAMKSQPNLQINYSTPMPSAPTLESTVSTNTYPNNAPAYFPQADASHSLAQNYPDAQKWDNRATRMLVMNRLQMQSQFDDVRTEMEKEVLWNMLLNQLLGYGYNFSVVELINFWEFQFEIYKSTVKNLQSGAVTVTDWEFFEPINKVFGYYDVSGLAEAVPSSSTSILSNTPIPIIVPIPTPLPGPSTTLPNSSEVPTSLNASSNDHVTSTLLPTSIPTNEIPQVPSNEQSPLLTQNNEATNSQTNPSLLSTNLNSGGDVSNNDQEPITTQPEGLSIPKLNDDNVAETVVTRQPTYNTQTMQQEATTTDNNRRNDDGCCGGNDTTCYPIFCIDCHDDYHYHHSYDDDCCYCCSADGGCCDGDGGGCDDFDCDGCDGC